MPELLAMVASTVNSYSRLVPGSGRRRSDLGRSRTALAPCARSPVRHRASASSTGSRRPTSIRTSRMAAALGSGLWGVEDQHRAGCADQRQRLRSGAGAEALCRAPCRRRPIACRVKGRSRSLRRRLRRPLRHDADIGRSASSAAPSPIGNSPAISKSSDAADRAAARNKGAIVSDIICISPFDGSVVARRNCAADAEITATLAAARKAQRAWMTTPLAERKAKMLEFLAAMQAKNDEIVPELAMQMGRPVRFGGELRSLEERSARWSRLATRRWPIEPAAKSGFRRLVKRNAGRPRLRDRAVELSLSHRRELDRPRVAGGERGDPETRRADLARRGAFPGGDGSGRPAEHLFTTLTLDHDATLRLIASRSVDHVSFTGSIEGGKAMERAAAGTFTSLGLELGGKDPAYVRADAEFDYAVENLVDGAFYNSGQSCCGVERIYVHEALYDRFVPRLRRSLVPLCSWRSARSGDESRTDGVGAPGRNRARPHG